MRETFETVGPDLRAYFVRRVPGDEADDLLGQTFLTAWRRVNDFPQDQEGRRRWLFAIAAKTLANHRRGWLRRSRVVAKLITQPTCVVEVDVAEIVAVREAVRDLPEGHRELVMLVHWEGFSVAEASEILQINPSTARSRYSVARKNLRAALEPTRSLVDTHPLSGSDVDRARGS